MIFTIFSKIFIIRVYKQNRINILIASSSFSGWSAILLWFSLLLLVSLHVGKTNCLCTVLVSNFGEHGFENILIFWQRFSIIIIEVKPNLSSEADAWRSLWWNESESIKFFWHFKVFTYQVENQPFVNLVAFLWFRYLKYKSTPVLVFRMLPTRLDSFLEKLNWIYFSCLIVHDIAKLKGKNTCRLYRLLSQNNWKVVQWGNVSINKRDLQVFGQWILFGCFRCILRLLLWTVLLAEPFQAGMYTRSPIGFKICSLSYKKL